MMSKTQIDIDLPPYNKYQKKIQIILPRTSPDHYWQWSDSTTIQSMLQLLLNKQNPKLKTKNKMKGCLSKHALQSCFSAVEGNKYSGRIRTQSSQSWLKPQTSIATAGLNREELEESLRILKNGAVFALAEKEEHLITASRTWTEHLQLYKGKLGECLSAQQELHRSHYELSQQIDEERQYLLDELSLRDEKIEHLVSLLQRMKEYIEQLQQSSRQKEQQLLREQQQNHKLRSMLEQSQLRNAIQSLELGQPLQKPIQICRSQISEGNVRKQYESCIQEMIIRHEQEIEKIVQLYEAKIQEKQQLQTQHQFVLDETPQKCSLKSLNRSRSDTDPRILHHTPSLASQPSVHNLREEISQEEQLSQFTKELFSLPSRFHKQKSHLSHPSLDPSRDLLLKDNKGSETEGDKREKQIDLFWQKTKSFAAGFFSGASVGSALSLLVLRWK